MATWQNLDTVQRAATGLTIPSVWGDQVNDDMNILGQLRMFRASAQCNASQSIPAGVDTLLALDTVSTDPNGNLNTTTHLYTVPTTGIYDIKASVVFGGGTAQGFLGLYINNTAGVPQAQGMRFPLGPSQGGTSFWTVQLTAGNTIGIDVWQSGAGAQTLLGAASRMTIQFWPF